MSIANQVQTSVSDFIKRWELSGSAERGNFQSFASELCDLLGVPRPDPQRPNDRDNAYVFERSVNFDHGDGTQSTGWIDLYRRGCFVMEAKQGSDADDSAGGLFAPAQLTPTGKLHKGTAVRGTRQWDLAMLKARGQAEQYVRALPASEGNPPFLVVVDVGHTIELYADFSRLGKTYTPFPDSQSHRIKLADLEDEKVREKLRLLWTDPMALDPSRRTAKVTREVAGQLAKLAKSLEASGHSPESVAEFLMRSLFTFFAEDVKLIVDDAFTNMLKSLRGKPEQFPHFAQFVWKDMDKGVAFSPILRQKLLRFNGGLFEHSDALPINEEQLELLIDAGLKDWSGVEPAIFGTLLERALDERERHKLGAHYTPRAYVERLVLPTVIEPLREQWQAAQAAAVALNLQGKPVEARAELHKFLAELCHTTVLDPACGSGNFLYVTMEHMKRIEGEVRDLLRQFGETQEVLERGGLPVDPHQFLGLEINKRAVAIADLVLWIGFLQWHFRTHGRALPAEPVLKKFENIKWQDAVLAYDKKELVLDEQGKPVTRWDGRTTKQSPITGEEIPDESARVPLYAYVNPSIAQWPRADYVVGNPPFIGGWLIRGALGDGYVDALWTSHPDIPEKADFVMYWWDHAADLARLNQIKRFGFITTNSVTQVFQRRVLAKHIKSTESPLRLIFAVPDHPWVDEERAAAVRVAMTVGTGQREAETCVIKLGRVVGPEEDEDQVQVEFETAPQINEVLSSAVGPESTFPLNANDGICSPGVQLYGAGFVLNPSEVAEWRTGSDWPQLAGVVHPYMNGRDLMGSTRGAHVIDFFGLTKEEAAGRYARAFQRVVVRVKPEREQNRRESIKENWESIAPLQALRGCVAGFFL